MDIEKTTQVLEGISLGLMRIIEIFAPIMLAGVLGAMKGITMSTANINAVKQKVDKIKQLTNEQDQI